MLSRKLILMVMVLMFSSVTFGMYFAVDYFMDHAFPKIFGQACDDYIHDDCAFVNSHLNTFGHWDYRGHVQCKMTLDAGKQSGAKYKLKWHRFKVEASDCSDDKDYIEFHNASLHYYSTASLIGRYCGWTYPDPNLTDYMGEQYLTMIWHTDGIREDKGWRFMATRILPYPCPSGDYYHCKAENVCIDGRLKCDGIQQCNNGEDEIECSIWEKILGGFLALGTAGVTGISLTCLFLCIVVTVLICCVIKHLRNDDNTVKIATTGAGGADVMGGKNKVAPSTNAGRPRGSRWRGLMDKYRSRRGAGLSNNSQKSTAVRSKNEKERPVSAVSAWD